MSGAGGVPSSSLALHFPSSPPTAAPPRRTSVEVEGMAPSQPSMAHVASDKRYRSSPSMRSCPLSTSGVRERAREGGREGREEEGGKAPAA